MDLTVGTFNLNNLFSRFNFEGAIEAIASAPPEGATGITLTYEFTDPETYRLRTFKGDLIKEKDPEKTQVIAGRIEAIDVDVLAVQEVEDIDILEEFNSVHLNRLYSQVALLEGNDARFIDVGILSKFPLRAITSFRTEVHPADDTKPVFSRDLLEVEVWNQARSQKLLTIYNNHLKSKYVAWDDPNPQATTDAANTRRERQAEVVASIVEARQRPDGRYVILGDMNETPNGAPLQPLIASQALNLSNALAAPAETRAPKPEASGSDPTTTAWTYRHTESGQPPQHLLYDQIWVSPNLSTKLVGSTIDRRKNHGGDGSDHDPAWIELAGL